MRPENELINSLKNCGRPLLICIACIHHTMESIHVDTAFSVQALLFNFYYFHIPSPEHVRDLFNGTCPI